MSDDPKPEAKEESPAPDDAVLSPVTEENPLGEALDEPSDLETVLAERDDLRDRLLRSLAELENVRKRAERDRRDAEQYGGIKLARDLLSVHDNLGRALDAVDETLRTQASALIEGIELTQRDLLEAFRKNKIEAVSPEMGERFDPKLHQAMFEAPSPDHPQGTVMQVLSQGFVIGERLLRPAHVGVSAGAPPGAAPADGAPEAEGA